MRLEDINSLESESGVIATLIKHPNLYYVAEHLLPEHFVKRDNQLVYIAIKMIVNQNMGTVDPYSIIQVLNSTPETRRYADELSLDKLNELFGMSDVLARHNAEDYKMLVGNVIDAAFRRETYSKLMECQKLCVDREEDNVEQRIYDIIDKVMMDYSSTNEVPPFSEVIDKCWEEIKSRQGTGYAGIPFISEALSEYVTIEKGELVIFAAEAKQGKSMWLLNETADLLKRGKSVLYLDSELSDVLFTKRILSHLSGVEYRRLATGNYTEEEADEIERQREWIKQQKFTHLYIPMFDLQSIYTAVKKVFHMQGGLDVLVVDRMGSH